MLIPAELLEFPGPAATLDPELAARELGVPVGELRLELGHALLERPSEIGVETDASA
jgi:hypothetical protein